MLCLLVRTCTVCIPGVQGGQKVAPEPLELELQMVVRGYDGAGNQM